MAGAGWCRHPDRIDLRSDLVLERASHLGCRRGWDEHSWEPLSNGECGDDGFDRVRPIGPVPPASPAEIGSLLQADRRASSAAQLPSASDLEVDRVVETVPSPMQHIPRALLNRPAVATDHESEEGPAKEPDTRETILRAREVQRARVNNRIRTSVQPLSASASTQEVPPPVAPTAPQASQEPFGASIAPSTTTVVPGTERDASPIGIVPTIGIPPGSDLAVLEPTGGQVVLTAAPVKRAALHLPSTPLSTSDTPSRRLRLVPRVTDYVPDLTTIADAPDVVRLEHVVVRDNESLIDEDKVIDPLPTVDPERREDRARPERTSARKPKSGTFSFRRRWNDVGRAVTQHEHRVEGPAEVEQWPALGVESEPLGTVEHDDERLIGGILPDLDTVISEDFSPRPEDVTEHAADSNRLEAERQETERPTAVSGDAWAPVEVAADAMSDVVVARNTIAAPILFDPAIDAYVIAPDVIRTCDTCSAFRPAAGGERGWCSNGWAFDSRQFVGGQGVPCASSVGDWWLPNDDYWDDGVIERLTAPAPLFDRDVWPKYAPAPIRQRPVPRRRGR